MNNGRISKGHRIQFKGAPSAQPWADLSIKINMVTGYNSINKIRIHESILIQVNKWRKEKVFLNAQRINIGRMMECENRQITTSTALIHPRNINGH